MWDLKDTMLKKAASISPFSWKKSWLSLNSCIIGNFQNVLTVKLDSMETLKKVIKKSNTVTKPPFFKFKTQLKSYVQRHTKTDTKITYILMHRKIAVFNIFIAHGSSKSSLEMWIESEQLLCGGFKLLHSSAF